MALAACITTSYTHLPTVLDGSTNPTGSHGNVIGYQKEVTWSRKSLCDAKLRALINFETDIPGLRYRGLK